MTSIRGMDQNAVYLWGLVMGALQKEPMLDMQGWFAPDGIYEDFVDVKVRNSPSGTTIRIQIVRDEITSDDSAKADLVQMLKDLS